MCKIIYNPDNVKTEIVNKRGKIKTLRKFHMTPEEMIRNRKKWLVDVKSVDKDIRSKSHRHFFNPYRRGIYYYQIQTLYLLGANEWHSFPDILSKLESYTSDIPLSVAAIKKYGYKNAWDKFKGKSKRECGVRCRDYMGRIMENFELCQRLSMSNPYGYKLHQVCSAIDVKRVDMKGFAQGAYFYRLSTYNSMKKALPIKDFSGFTFPSHEGRYLSYKFIGTIISKDKVIKNGVIV